MTDTPDQPPARKPPAITKVKRRMKRRAMALIALCGVLLLAGLLVGTVRYGAVTPQGRLFLEARTDGLKLGRFGRLKIEGLQGDIWRDFTIRRLTVSDQEGVWLEANQVHMIWRASELFSRRFHAEDVAIASLRLIKRPTLDAPGGPSREMPVSIALDKVAARVETLPAFSVQRGLFDLEANLDVARGGGTKGAIAARSLLHAGDHLNASFNLGRGRTIALNADVEEASGGAVAGALGLPVGQPFALRALASGTMGEGRFEVASRSGPLTPVQGRGTWGPRGGGAALALDLEASSLTQRFADMIGPDARLQIGAAKSPTGRQAVNVQGGGANLQFTAIGEVDMGERRAGPQGVRVTATTPNLDRITPWPKAGAARVQAVLTGGLDDFALAGQAELRQVSANGFSMARLSGPARIARRSGQFDIDATLQGEGGAGAGLVPALLGARPALAAKISVLERGRLMLREVRLRGSGITVDGTGGLDLLRRLTFKGNASITNLAAVRAGARGTVSGAVSAVQGGADRPWAFTIDATGANFATGMAELDRLLGPAPKFKGEADWAAGEIRVASARLDGAAGTVGGKGVFTLEGSGLAFDLDWNAKGPFTAGPVEIAGDVKGVGKVSGTLDAPAIALQTDVASIDLPRLPLRNARIDATFAKTAAGGDGRLSVTAESQYGPARAAGGFRFIEGGVDLSGIDADAAGVKAAGSLSLRSSRPSAADLTVEVTRGAFLDAGRIGGTVRITDAPGGPRAVVRLTGEAVTPPGGGTVIRNISLTGDGPLDRLPITIDATGRQGTRAWNISGTGTVLNTSEVTGLDLSASGRFAGAELATREPMRLRLNDAGPTVQARLNLGGGQADLDLNLGAAKRLNAAWRNVSLGLLDQDLGGTVAGSAQLEGQGSRLTGEAKATLTGARQLGISTDLGLNADVTATLAGTSLTIEATGGNGQGLSANGRIVLPVEASAEPLRLAVNTRSTIRGAFQAQGEVAPLWALFVGGDRRLSGRAEIDTLLAGTLADLRILGTADMEGGRFQDFASGLELRDVNLSAEFRDVVADLVSASATDGNGGRLTGQGRIGLRRASASNLTLQLNRFTLIDNDIGTAQASGQARLERDADGKVAINGDLTIDRATIFAEPPTPSGVVALDVIERNRPERLDEQPALAQRRPFAVALDVDLTAARGINVEGRGLDAELSLDAHVGGTTAAPQLSGTARIVRGEYNFAGKRFLFDTRGSVRLDTAPERILLDLSATREDPSLTAVVQIGGTAARPTITLTSTPQLPSDEVLSQVLFGASAAQLSPLEAAQLASALSSLAGGGGFDVIGGLRSFAGLDRLAFAGGGETGVTVSGGKYLTDNVYLEIIGGGREGPAAQVEWRVQRSLSIISRLTGQGGAALSVRWRKDD